MTLLPNLFFDYFVLQYKSWRKEVFENDNFTCWFCGNRGGKLEAHHIYEISKFPDFKYDITNGVTLCKKYHRSIRGKEEAFRRNFYE